MSKEDQKKRRLIAYKEAWVRRRKERIEAIEKKQLVCEWKLIALETALGKKKEKRVEDIFMEKLEHLTHLN